MGGTDLVTASAGGPWKSEAAWVDSGGGISLDKIAIPSWQKSAINSTDKGSTVYRNGPDVAANANFTFYTCDDRQACLTNEYGGTSFAAPMDVGGLHGAGQPATGVGWVRQCRFPGPRDLFGDATAATYKADFHDVTSGTSGSYSATTNFALVTGWGSPTPNLITTLAP